MSVFMEKFFVTTPIYYINDKPHIGHAYSTIIADVLARYHRLKGEAVLFSAGVDENAQKTIHAAEAAGKDPTNYTQDMSDIWETTWQQVGITNDVFIRTTSPQHKAAVYELIKRVEAKGDISKGTYEGYYCVGCEAFKKEDDLVEGLCPDHKKKPEWLKEENYFFSLSAYQDQLLAHIEKNPDFIKPPSRRNEVVAFIKRGLQDFSVSRSTQKWGIPWPGDDAQVVYVWFDALVNYLTVTGFPNEQSARFWPADLHIVGKDIIKFHCIYWPAMLLSAGIPLPKTVFAHGFFTIDGQKVSKTLGNTIDPLELASTYGLDSLRYFLLREIPLGGDGDFSFERIARRYESDLAKGLGNFVSRVVTLASKTSEPLIPPLECDARIEVEKAWGQWSAGLEAYELDRSLDAIWRVISWGDKHIEEKKPWTLAPESAEYIHVIATLGEVVRQVGLLLSPFMPQTAEKITELLGIRKEASGDFQSSRQWGVEKFGTIEKGKPLFPPVS